MDDFDDMLMVDETDELLTSTLTQPAKSTNGEEDVKPETLSEKKLKKKVVKKDKGERFLDNLTDGCSIVEHSTMALDIHPKLFPMYISPNALRHFHRAPLNKYNVGQALANFHSLNLVFENNVKSYVKEDPYLWPNGKPETLDELSAQEGNVLLIEYLEEHPPLLSQPGMSSKILNYLQVSEDGLKNGLECENLSEFGESTLVEGSPFLGSLPLGKRLQAVENNMYRSPIFQHSANPNDFLLVVSKENICLRKCPALFLAGQQFPLLQVPSPGSKLACDFVKNSLNAYMYRLFHASTDNPRRLRSEDIKSTFPHYSDSTIYKRLRPIADFIKPSGIRDADGNAPSNYWTLKPESENIFLPTYEEIRNLLTPEMCCAQYSMLVAEMKLTLAGYANDNFMILSKNEEDGGEDNVTMEDEVLNAPWNTTKTFIDAMKGICMLDDSAIADPTGVGQGFSYVRMCRKPISTQKEPRRKIIGTEADLRKLTLQEAKDLCRELGVQEEKLSVLSRWQIINVIRSISTQAAKTDKDDASLADAASKFARGNMKMNAHRIKIKRHCQKIFETQNRILSDPTLIESDFESETENTKNSGDLDESKLDEDWEMEEIIVKTETGHDELDYQIAATSKPFQNSRVQVKQEHVDVENLLDLNGLRKTWNEAQKTHSNEIVNRQSPFCIKSEENDAIATESGIKELKIVRAIKDSAGNEHTEIESITDPTLIEAYLSIRATRDELFVKNYAQADMDYKSECRKAKRRLQDKVRRRRRNEMNAELGITRPKKRRTKKPAKPIKESLLRMNCSACKGTGHMKTNKNCPLYRQRHRPTRDYSEEGSSNSELDDDEEENGRESSESNDTKPLKIKLEPVEQNTRLRSSGRLSTKRARFSPTPSDSSYSRKSRNRSTGPENGADLLHYLKKEALDN